MRINRIFNGTVTLHLQYTKMTPICGWCANPASTRCTGCFREWYCSQECQKRDWKEGGHKILCKDLKNGIATAEPLIATLNPPPNREDGFGVVQSSQERAAQDICWSAMDAEGLPEKIDLVLQALKAFPLCIEAWGMLGAFYRYDLPIYQRDYEQSVRMYENAIKSARKLNPSWTDDRTECLEYGHVETRPYIRALQGRAMALKESGRIDEAIQEAKKLLKWHENNPIGQLLCNWFLEAGDTQGFLQLYADQHDEGRRNAPLTYSYVLYQFLRWKKGEVVEKAVEKALCAALEENQFIPDLLLQQEDIQEIQMQYVDSCGPKEAHSYAVDAQSIWRAHPAALEWLATKKSSQNEPIPDSSELIRLLRSKIDVRVRCEHTALNGSDKKMSFVYANQRRDTSVGCALPDFYWPRELDNEYSPGDPILMFRNDLFDDNRPQNSRLCWRKTTQEAILEVPFWKVLDEGIVEGWIKE